MKRPLILPPGDAEGSIAAGLGRQSFGKSSLTYSALAGIGRVGFGVGEVFARCDLVPYHNGSSQDVDVPTLQRVEAGALLRVTDDTGVGPRFTAIGSGSDLSGYAPSLLVEHKLHPSANAALVVIGVAQYSDQHVPLGSGVIETRSIGAGAGGALQLQVTPTVAFEAMGTIAEVRFIEEGHAGSRFAHAYSYGADVTIAVTDHLDVVPLFSVVPIADLDTLVVGLEITGH